MKILFLAKSEGVGVSLHNPKATPIKVKLKPIRNKKAFKQMLGRRALYDYNSTSR